MWTEKVTETFKQLYAADKSFGLIAQEMRKHGVVVSRNACIGKAHRLGLPKRKQHSNVIALRRRPRRDRVSFRPEPKPRPKMSPVPVAPTPEAAPVIITTEFRMGLLELDNHNCRYPLWADGAPFAEQFYCGTPTADLLDGRPYCSGHHHVSFAPARQPQPRPYFHMEGR